MQFIQAGGRQKSEVVTVEPPRPEITKAKDGVVEKTNITTEPSRTTVVDLERISKRHLLQYTSGSPWPVDYYHRLSGMNDPKSFFDPAVDNATQQYEEIKSQVLRVGSALSWSQGTNKEFTVSGEATLANSIIPTEGDIFIADIGDARRGIFAVNSTQRNAYNKIATYQITYTLLYEVSPESERVLRDAVVRTFHYVADRAWVSEDTLLTQDEFNAFLKIREELEYFENMYVRMYYDQELGSLRQPVTARKNYDVFLTQFVRDIGLNRTPDELTIYPHTPYRHDEMFTVWKALVWHNASMLPQCHRDGKWFQVQTFRTYQVPNTVGWSRVQSTVFFDSQLRLKNIPDVVPDFDAVEDRRSDFEGTLLKDLPMFVKPTLTPYVFTEAFYGGSYGSVLEYALQLYLNKAKLRADIPLKLAEEVKRLPLTAQFYFAPVVYLLLKYVR
ncbi:virion structural protein [Erwinia phage Derbicus]|uniref:Putative virion structural protein n=2 Tax=Derbicusvirus derbicus TaxID=2734104 RepID=A0A482IIX5_9CAUD|nr:virion structural protein [Erwinia phage vB_EamM_EarlPhillipIV]YP_009821105.1 virion structural protein [Erwinia phage Derbicus]ANZ48911.1 putative virion structural protein [Erwinia phage vB_EamM_EarlPhillipIV]QBP07487.1 putative virion structural protein [Erwinia phage Derbicus]